jgi:hypothetical protein
MTTQERLLDAVKGLLADLPEMAGGTVAVRKTTYYDRERGETLPLAVVSVLADEAVPLLGGEALDVYPVVVTLVLEGDLTAEGPGEMLALRRAVREALYVTEIDGVPEVFDCDYDPDAPFDNAALDTGLDCSAQLFTYSCQEGRG